MLLVLSAAGLRLEILIVPFERGSHSSKSVSIRSSIKYVDNCIVMMVAAYSLKASVVSLLLK